MRQIFHSSMKIAMLNYVGIIRTIIDILTKNVFQFLYFSPSEINTLIFEIVSVIDVLTICEKSLQRKLVPSHNIEITNWKDQIIMKILLFSVLILLTDGANILILHPVYSGSHEHVLRTVGEHLVENRGHNVTQVNGSGLPFSRLKFGIFETV